MRWEYFFLVCVVCVVGAPAMADTPLGTAFTYQGRLTQNGASYAGTSANLQFSLWDAAGTGNPPAGGTLLGTQCVPGVPITGGLFTVTLNAAGEFGPNAFNGQARWLQIGVSADAACTSVTTLAPRQPLTAAPYALYALNGPAGGCCFWAANGSDIRNTNPGNVDIGTTARSAAEPEALLEIRADQNTTEYLHLSGFDNADPTKYPVMKFMRARGSATTPTKVRWHDLLGSVHAWGYDGVAYHEAAGIDFKMDADVDGPYNPLPGRIELSTAALGQTTPQTRMVIDQAGKVGIGTTTPQASLHVQGEQVLLQSFGGAPQFTAQAAKGSSIAPTPVGLGQLLVQLGGFGYDGTTFNNGGGWIELDTDTVQSWDATHHPTAWLFATTDTTPNASRSERMRIAPNGTIGIGTTTPNSQSKLHVAQSNGTFGVYSAVTSTDGIAVQGINLASVGGGDGVVGQCTSAPQGVGVFGSGRWKGVYGIAAGPSGVNYGVYGSSNSPDGYGGYFEGKVSVGVLEIRGGADLAEPFNINKVGKDPQRIEPGMVVVIDPDHPGELKLATEPYDSKVAGVVSGANGLKPGMVMKSEGTPLVDGDHPVALTGRVWTLCDASKTGIQPGDLLTTSATSGHAMKVTDHARAQGAIIGKAMTRLTQGQKGLVLVLVSLQ